MADQRVKPALTDINYTIAHYSELECSKHILPGMSFTDHKALWGKFVILGHIKLVVSNFVIGVLAGMSGLMKEKRITKMSVHFNGEILYYVTYTNL